MLITYFYESCNYEFTIKNHEILVCFDLFFMDFSMEISFTLPLNLFQFWHGNPWRVDQAKRQILWKKFRFRRFRIRENIWWTRYRPTSTSKDKSKPLLSCYKFQTLVFFRQCRYFKCWGGFWPRSRHGLWAWFAQPLVKRCL